MYRASERYLTSLKEVYTIIDIVAVYTVLHRSHNNNNNNNIFYSIIVHMLCVV